MSVMGVPKIIVNFKLYEQGTGEAALELAKLHEKIALETGVNIGIAVNALDLAVIAGEVSIPVFAQGMDPVGYGSHTGSINADLLKNVGAYGVVLNHAERPLEYVALGKCVERAREAGLFSVVCVDTVEQGKIVEKYCPDLIALEPPGLIGGTVSLADVDPGMIESCVSALGRERVLIGAGVRDANDVRISLLLGAVGVLLSSGVVKAEDQEEALRELALAVAGFYGICQAD